MNPALIGILLTVVIGLGWATWKAPRLTSAIWWAFLATVLVSAAVISLVPGDLRLRMIWTSFAVPFIWTGLLFWCYWETKAWRVAAGMISLTVVSGILVFLFKPTL